jgi:Fe-S-cluster-containing hydrogenase component 2
MKRKMIEIDQTKCDGCGLCIPNCPEGAIRIVDGKAKLVSDSLCDGLGACLGHCPQGAITVLERNAESYDERKVIKNVISQGHEALEKHLQHLREHNETENLRIAHEYLNGQKTEKPRGPHGFSGCPGSQSMSFSNHGTPQKAAAPVDNAPSSLTHWPIQLHLLSPQAPHYYRKDLLLAADCVPFALSGFHAGYLRGKVLAIACPKLDDGQEIYVEKLTELIDHAEINSLTVMTMVVPCCMGLLHLAQSALAAAKRKIPLKHIVVGLQGEVIKEDARS